MISGYPRALTMIAAVGAGLSAGVFFAFSTFVMKALGRLPDTDGISAMQAINKAAPTPAFMARPLWHRRGLCRPRRVGGHPAKPTASGLAAGRLRLVSRRIVLTAALPLPRNDALARVNPTSAGAATKWSEYLTGWTAWNHLRTVSCLGSAVIFTVALRVG